MTPVWIRWRDEWRPGEWVSTVSRGKRAGYYTCLLGFKRKRVVVHPNQVTERKLKEEACAS